MFVYCYKSLTNSLIRSSWKPYHQQISFMLKNQKQNDIFLISSCQLFSSSIQYKTSSNDKKTDQKSQVVIGDESRHQLSGNVKVTERIKQTTKDVTNFSIIIVGIGITGIVFWAVFKEFFSSKSPSGVFASALKKCKNDPRVTELLGSPIKGHGEMTARRWARHVAFVEYENNGKKYLRIKFYLKGTQARATVHCETDKNSRRNEFRYLFVETETYPPQVIIIEDNRLIENYQT